MRSHRADRETGRERNVQLIAADQQIEWWLQQVIESVAQLNHIALGGLMRCRLIFS